MDWHRRYLQQAAWTRDLRSYLFTQSHISAARRILEVGCGTGAVLGDLALPDTEAANRSDSGRPISFGVDTDSTALAACHLHAPSARLSQADVFCLPFADQSFDVTFCHFVLLWIREPLVALAEMKRVTRHGGGLLALAEPDYTARVDRPQALTLLGTLQNQSLIQQGADIALGAQLANLFAQAGIRVIETGVIAPPAEPALAMKEAEDEWEVLRADLVAVASEPELGRLQRLDAQARARGERVLYVPTYFAHGQV